MPRYRCVLFDADGTLFDYDRGERAALTEALSSVGIEADETARATYKRVNHALWLALERGEVDAVTLRLRRFEHLLTELDHSLDLAPTAAGRYLEALGRATDLIDGAEELVEGLAGRASLAIITNGLTEVQRSRFALSPLTRHFDAITISDELGVAKPDPRIVDHTLAQLGDPPRDEVVIVGDSLTSDIQAGVNANIATCWFAPGGQEPPEEPRADHVARSLAEVAGFLS